MEKGATKILLKDIKSYEGQLVEINGWIYNLRSSGKITFWQVRDGSDFVQVILSSDELDEAKWNEAQKATQETSVKITGIVNKHPKKNEYEIALKDFNFYQISEEWPIGNKDHGIDFLMDNRHLWLRAKRQWAIQRVRNTLIQATYEFFKNNDFTKIDSPILTPNAGENTTDLFKVKYFEEEAYLSQTGQLYLEAALPAHGRVYDFGPTFRAEKSKTRRHLTEFWMMDAEMAFIDLNGNLAVQEALIKSMIKAVLATNQNELIILERDTAGLQNVITKDFYRMTHAEAVKELQALGSDIKEDEDLGGDDETLLTKKYDNPIFVTNYPAKIKAFYSSRNADDPELAECADLLASEGYGEITSASQREADYETLKQRIIDFGLKAEDYQWYLDLRKYGSVPHGGFGFGLERIVTWVCGLEHVREAIPFARTLNRLWP
jgi:asparaginyl-tRNA synthetase